MCITAADWPRLIKSRPQLESRYTCADEEIFVAVLVVVVVIIIRFRSSFIKKKKTQPIAKPWCFVGTLQTYTYRAHNVYNNNITKSIQCYIM